RSRSEWCGASVASPWRAPPLVMRSKHGATVFARWLAWRVYGEARVSDPARSVWRGALAGLVGGLLAAGAMSLAHQMLPKADTPADEGNDATVKTVDAVMRRLAGRPLPESAKPAASQIVH